MNHLIGINTGIIKSPQGVVAMVLKFVTKSQNQHLVYLPLDQIQSLFFATFSGYRMLIKLFQNTPESVRELVTTQTNSLTKHIPSFTFKELNFLNPELRVTNFVMKMRTNSINTLFFLHNGEVIPLEITFAQLEYLLNMLLNTIKKCNDESFATFCLSANDYLPIYAIDFSSDQGKRINYNHYSSPEWKGEVFDTLYSIIYVQSDCIIPCGAIIKGVPNFDHERIEDISRVLLNSNPLLSVYKDLKMTIDYIFLDIKTSEENMDTLLRSHLAHRNARLN